MNQNIEPTSEVEWIEIQVPVFTGEVSERTPDFIDGDCCDFLTTTQRAAIGPIASGRCNYQRKSGAYSTR